MKRFPYEKDGEFIGARYEFERPEFGEDTFQVLSNQLEQVLSEIPDSPGSVVQEFYFFHPVYELGMPIVIPTNVRELKDSLTFFANKKDRLHQIFVMTFLPDSVLAYQVRKN